MTTKDEIISNGTTVWVNSGKTGNSIGRFSKMGIDIHNESADGCIDCKPGPTTLEDWRRFQTGMYHHYGVTVDDKHMPDFLR